MTFATKLTLSRIAAVPFFLAAFCIKSPDAPLAGDWGKVIAAILFIAASITDYFDGYFARLHKEVTNFGKFLDPIADKVLVATALIVMVQYNHLTQTQSWAAVIIIAREFCVTGLRLICVEQGNVIAASKAGKLKTGLQLTAIITCLIGVSCRVVFQSYGMTETDLMFKQYLPYVNYTLMTLAVIATIYSGYDYFKKNRQFLDQ